MATLPNRIHWMIGRMAESAIKPDQRIYAIYVAELLPTVTGDVSPETADHTVQLINAITGKTEDITVAVTKTITAEYWGFESNRTPPVMYKNQQVLVFNYANTDKWYWIPADRDDYLKPFDRLVFQVPAVAVTNKTDAVGDDIEGKMAGLNEGNTYGFEIDTKYNKHILFRTSAADGEAFRYFFKIDTVAHTVEIWDEPTDGGNSNRVILNSDEKRIKLQTAGNAMLDLENQNLTLRIPGNVTYTIGGNVIGTVQGKTVVGFLGTVDSKIIGAHTHLQTAPAAVTYMTTLSRNIIGLYTTVNVAGIISTTEADRVHKQNNNASVTTKIDTDTALTKTSTYIQHNLTVSNATWKVDSFSNVWFTLDPSRGDTDIYQIYNIRY